MATEQLGAAIVGLGWWGQHIIRSLAGSEKIAVRRAVDVRPDAASALLAEHGIDLSSSLDAVLRDEGVEAVILATPHSLHEEQIVAVAAAGKHCFCEKPLTLTRAGAERAIAACAAAGVQLGIGHERRYEPALEEVARMVVAGELGTVMHVESNFSHDKLAGVDPGDWRAKATDAPAAGMTGMGIHLSDAYLAMLGPIEEVYAQTAQRVLAWECGDVVSVHVRFASGATGYLNAILVTPLFLRFQVFGSEAWVEARNATHPDTPGPTELTVHRAGEAPQSRTFEWIDTVRANFEAFADAVHGRAPYRFTDAQKLGNVAVLEAIVRSVERGAPVRV